MNSATHDQAQLLIVADDLSGAADCAVAGLRHGLQAMVLLDTNGAPTSTANVEVLAVDLDSRRASKEEAAQRNVVAVNALGRVGTRVYKKMDSTVRGNFAPEVAALVSRIGMAVFCPAYPVAGRTTRDGRQWVRGVAVEESEFWRNEGILGKADLVAMLSGEELKVGHISIDAVRIEADALARQMKQMQMDGVQAVVCDAETDDDLRLIACASAQLEKVFWVGSAGLASAVMDALKLSRHASEVTKSDEATGGPVLTVVGSMSSVSHAQLDCLKANAGDNLLALEVATSALETLDADFTTVVCEALRRGQHVVVSLSQTNRGDVNDGLRFCGRLASLLAPAVPIAGGIIATGGETARALLGEAGASALHVVEEIEDGMPLLACHLGGRALPVVTKAGGFGQPESLYNAWRWLADKSKTANTAQANV
ncbi:four-carbon acid sugar kinase family protein [Burkholderia pyrrocinia]|uniref:four-carbon acid sugar kinase family protein n=1 Tax=Burkholderia pyrrocinia TaxID=60550 RepID=UPI001F4235C0|nr:four-carbon acid sugar kinase family protein [Burkholderia pyrrocinia]